MWIEMSFAKKSWKKNNVWNIRRLVDDSFIPSAKRTNLLYCRLTDFKSNNKLLLKLHVDITQSSSNSLTQPASFLFALTYCLILRWWAMFKQNKTLLLGTGEFSVKSIVGSNSVIKLKKDLFFEDFLIPMSFLKTSTIHQTTNPQKRLVNVLTFTSKRFR